MRFAGKRGAVWGWLLAACAGVAGCDGSREAGAGKPVIAVSIFPLANLVEQLTGEWADVVTLLPASASPHTAEFTPDQVRLLARADLIVVVGMGLDPWAEKAAAAADSKRIELVRFADLIADDAKNQFARRDVSRSSAVSNNHLWLDPVLAGQFVAALSGQLEHRYPEHATEIQSAANRLRGDLERLDHEYAEQLAAVPRKDLITFHNAFDLIAERYHLNILVRLTDIEISPGGEVTPDKLREALDAIKKYKLKALYAETEFPDQVIRRLHEETETGVDVLLLDPQGNPAVEGYRTYQQMMRSNLKTLVRGQSE